MSSSAGSYRASSFATPFAGGRRPLGVSGWIRNTGDGAVEAVFEGEPDAVSQLVAFCREGPRGARVDAVEVTDEAPEGLRGFAIR